MKFTLGRNVFSTIILVTISSFLFSQTYKVSDILPGDVNWVKVTGMPEIQLETAGIDSYMFHVDDSNMLKLYSEKKGKLTQIASFDEQCLFNPNKAEKLIYVDGEVTMCSELSYKSTSVCCLFNFKKAIPEFVRLMVSDQDGDYLYRGDSLLLLGEVEKAVKAYEQIAKPSNYMDVIGKGVEILEIAHALALESAEKKDYKKAAGIMESALRFKGLWILDANEFDNLVQLEKYQKEIWKYNRSITDLLESYIVDYAFFLYQSGKVSQSVSYNSYLSIILPHNPIPCLNWANGLYKMGQTELAKQAYKMYVQRVEKSPDEYIIPDYVLERIR